MRFVSTRGHGEAADAPRAVLRGIAPDGGLYVPGALPDLSDVYRPGMPYPELAFRVFRALLPGFLEDDLLGAAEGAYVGPFSRPEV
ncbi:MAG TPA: threonine synthase, partial [Candidatus Limnocylindria bacterium]|nr:threonine synthase [Candidatus Limnocylindria bacterium]